MRREGGRDEELRGWGQILLCVTIVAQPLVELTAQEDSINRLTGSQYSNLIDYFNRNANVSVTPAFRDLNKDDFRRITVPGNSTSLWVISPPAREQLVGQLEGLKGNTNNTAVLEFDWAISRYSRI